MAQRLLLIDENIRLLTLVGDYLSKLGYEVHRASESDEVDALLKNYEYSVVITGTDWQDFGDTGHNLAQCVMNLANHPRIIFLEEKQASSRDAPFPGDGAILVVEKPISLLRLGTLMHELPVA